MPMIDVYSVAGTFRDKHTLAKDLASAVMRWEKVPPIALFKNNTAAFVHDLPPDSMSNAGGERAELRRGEAAVVATAKAFELLLPRSLHVSPASTVAHRLVDAVIQPRAGRPCDLVTGAGRDVRRQRDADDPSRANSKRGDVETTRGRPR